MTFDNVVKALALWVVTNRPEYFQSPWPEILRDAEGFADAHWDRAKRESWSLDSWSSEWQRYESELVLAA